MNDLDFNASFEDDELNDFDPQPYKVHLTYQFLKLPVPKLKTFVQEKIQRTEVIQQNYTKKQTLFRGQSKLEYSEPQNRVFIKQLDSINIGSIESQNKVKSEWEQLEINNRNKSSLFSQLPSIRCLGVPEQNEQRD